MATVTHTVTKPDGSTPGHVHVKIELISSIGIPLTTSYITSSGAAVAGTYEINTTNGQWSVTLVNNSLITPSNTYYRVTHLVDYRASYVDSIRATGTTGTFSSMLVEAPASLPSAASQVYTDAAIVTHVAAIDPHADRAFTTTSINALKAKTPDELFPRQHGFTVESANRAYSFLCFGPTGQVIASSHRSVGGKTVSVSTDDMVTWTDATAPDPTFEPDVAFCTAAGSLIVNVRNIVYRSTDLGQTWATVLTLSAVAPAGAVLSQGISEGPSGTLWLCEYQGTGKVYRSTDDGATWSLMYDFATSDEVAASPPVRHLHGVAVLPSGVWVYTGDNGTQCGLWKWDGVSSFVRQTPSDSDPTGQQWRAVGLVERSGNLYWIQDGAGSTNKPVIGYAPASAPTTFTKIADLPIGGWYIRSLSDGTIIVSGVVEAMGQEEDDRLRLWAIDSSNNLHELWSIRRHPSAVAGAYASATNLAVRSSDNAIGFWARNTEAGNNGSDAHVSILGKFRPGGGRRSANKPPVTHPLFGTGQRTWAATPTTSGPTTVATAGAPDTLAEMTLTVNASGAPILVLFSAAFSHGTAGAVTSHGFSVDGAGVPTADTREMHAPGNGYIQNVKLVKLWTPTPGVHTIAVKWWVSAGTATARFTERTFFAAELGTAAA